MAQSSQKAVVIQISGQLYLKTYGSKVFLDANFPDASKWVILFPNMRGKICFWNNLGYYILKKKPLWLNIYYFMANCVTVLSF